MTNAKKPKRHANKALSALRTEQLLAIRLDGAEFWDLREFVREQEKTADSPWFLEDGDDPMSDSQIRIYMAKADDLIQEAHDENRERLYRRHLAQRRRLYARAVAAGDVGTALRVLRDEAQMIGLYPSSDDAALKELQTLKGELDKALAEERNQQDQEPVGNGQEPPEGGTVQE